MIPIHLRNLPPPIEKFEHILFFEYMASIIKPERYLELGVRCGSNFRRVAHHSKEAIAVDIVDHKFPLSSNMAYHQMTTDQYFSTLSPDIEFDMVFIDADHSHQQSLKDFENVSGYVIEDGFIFLHDTYPCHPQWITPSVCDGVYKTALFIKQNYADKFESITLPFQPGVTIVKKINRNKQLIWL